MGALPAAVVFLMSAVAHAVGASSVSAYVVFQPPFLDSDIVSP